MTSEGAKQKSNERVEIESIIELGTKMQKTERWITFNAICEWPDKSLIGFKDQLGCKRID